MSNEVYARIEGGKIVEFPVLPIHIENRAHPYSMYTLVDQGVRPEVPRFHDLSLSIALVAGTPVVSYALNAQSLEQVLNGIHGAQLDMMPGFPDTRTAKAISEIDQETVEKVVELASALATQKLNTFAQSRRYDSIISLATYVTSANEKLASEAKRAVDLRDQVQTALYGFLEEVQAGTTPVPRRVSEITDRLPALTWED